MKEADPATEFSIDSAAEVAPVAGARGAGEGPWRLALRRLRRNRAAIAFGLLFVVIAAACLAAPLWADHVAHTGPNANHLSDTTVIDGKETDVVSLGGIPIGPTWQGEFFLGADRNGRDTMVRLLYGGRNSLLIGVGAALLTALVSVILGIAAGYFGGPIDSVISRSLDVIWAYPVVLLGVALGVALALGGLQIGPVNIEGDSLAIPILVIAVVYVPYMARPIRGQVLSLREKEFVEAARAQGAGPLRLMFSELLPNLASTVVVFVPLLIANAILLEAALSFLGAGVQEPEPSWGTMIAEGVDLLISAEHLAIVPGLMLVLTVLSLNIFGEGVRDALDPRAKVRLEH
jgi:peptide/nickel transport system permease protein